eukprot:1183164-Prorocentrum_minimum.AAC.3
MADKVRTTTSITCGCFPFNITAARRVAVFVFHPEVTARESTSSSLSVYPLVRMPDFTHLISLLEGTFTRLIAPLWCTQLTSGLLWRDLPRAPAQAGKAKATAAEKGKGKAIAVESDEEEVGHRSMREEVEEGEEEEVEEGEEGEEEEEEEEGEEEKDEDEDEEEEEEPPNKKVRGASLDQSVLVCACILPRSNQLLTLVCD